MESIAAGCCHDCQSKKEILITDQCLLAAIGKMEQPYPGKAYIWKTTRDARHLNALLVSVQI